jgi:hypothetical protein
MGFAGFLFWDFRLKDSLSLDYVAFIWNIGNFL